MCVQFWEMCRTSPNYTNPQVFGSHRLYNVFIHFHMQVRLTNPQMHLNTSPTCLAGPRGRKIGFRDPGLEVCGWFHRSSCLACNTSADTAASILRLLKDAATDNVADCRATAHVASCCKGCRCELEAGCSISCGPLNHIFRAP